METWRNGDHTYTAVDAYAVCPHHRVASDMFTTAVVNSYHRRDDGLLSCPVCYQEVTPITQDVAEQLFHGRRPSQR
jgi:hypothetical protein